MRRVEDRKQVPRWAIAVTDDVYKIIFEKIKRATVEELEQVQTSLIDPSNNLIFINLKGVVEVYHTPESLLTTWADVPDQSKPEVKLRVQKLIQDNLTWAIAQKHKEKHAQDPLNSDITTFIIDTEPNQHESPGTVHHRSNILTEPRRRKQENCCCCCCDKTSNNRAHSNNRDSDNRSTYSKNTDDVNNVFASSVGLISHGIYMGTSDYSVENGVLSRNGPDLGFYDSNAYIGITDGNFVQGSDTTSDCFCCGSSSSENHSLGADGIINETNETTNYCCIQCSNTHHDSITGEGTLDSGSSDLECCGQEIYACENSTANCCYSCDIDCCGSDCCNYECADCCSSDCGEDICQPISCCYENISDLFGCCFSNLGNAASCILECISELDCADCDCSDMSIDLD